MMPQNPVSQFVFFTKFANTSKCQNFILNRSVPFYIDLKKHCFPLNRTLFPYIEIEGFPSLVKSLVKSTYCQMYFIRFHDANI